MTRPDYGAYIRSIRSAFPLTNSPSYLILYGVLGTILGTTHYLRSIRLGTITEYVVQTEYLYAMRRAFAWGYTQNLAHYPVWSLRHRYQSHGTIRVFGAERLLVARWGRRLGFSRVTTGPGGQDSFRSEQRTLSGEEGENNTEYG